MAMPKPSSFIALKTRKDQDDKKTKEAKAKRQNFGSGYSESDDAKPKAKVGTKKSAPSKVVVKAKGKK